MAAPTDRGTCPVKPLSSGQDTQAGTPKRTTTRKRKPRNRGIIALCERKAGNIALRKIAKSV